MDADATDLSHIAIEQALKGDPLDYAIKQLVSHDVTSTRLKGGMPVEATLAAAALAGALAQVAQAQQLKRIADALDTGDAAPFVVQVIP